MRCDGCQLEYERKETFKTHRRAFRAKDLVLCPACEQKRRFKTNRILFWIYWICGVLSLALVPWGPTHVLGLMLLSISVMQAAIIVSTILHEFGHALAGRLAGIRVFGIDIGKGPVVYEFSRWQLRGRLRALPLGGVTYGAAYAAALFRSRYCLFVLGGPMANAIILFASAKLLFLDQLFEPTFLHGFQPVLVMVFANIVLLATSLWPRTVNSTNGRTPNDALLMWKVCRYSNSQVREAIPKRHLYEAIESLTRKDFPAAQKWIEEGLRLDPQNLSLKISAAHILYRQKRYSEARRAFALLVGRPKKNETLDSLLLNNIAYSCVLGERPELLPKADVCSRLALASQRGNSHYKGTRGSVLIELGRYGEGLKLLHEALRDHVDPGSQALNACYIGIAEARRGNVAESRNYFACARRLDPDCILLDREAKTKGGS